MKKESIEIKNEYLTFIESLNESALPTDKNEEHAHHDELEIYHFVEGELFFSFEGDRIPVKDGDVIIISNGTLHKTIIKSPIKYHRRRILIKKDFFASMPRGALELQGRLSEKGIIALGSEAIEKTQLGKLLINIEESIKRNTPYDSFYALCALSVFLGKSAEIGEERTKKPTRPTGRAKSILKYIDEHLTDSLDYESIAETFHISAKNLYKVFKNETGFTLSKYIRMRRVIKAKALLNSGASPIEASVGAGFSDYSVFYRCFTCELGISPSKYIAKIKDKILYQ